MPDLTTTLMLAWLTICARQEKVNPAFCAGVFHVETRDKEYIRSGGKRGKEFRFGKLGKNGHLAGPAGLDRAYCREHHGVDPLDWRVNVLIGVRALKGDEHKVLRRYNTECIRAYEKAVFAAKARYQRELGE